MSFHLPARRVATTAQAAASKPSLHLQYLLPRTQRRNKGWFTWGGSDPQTLVKSPLLKELTQRQREQNMHQKNLDRTRGASIFDEEIKSAEQASQPGDQGTSTEPEPLGNVSRMKEHMERALNPNPRWRVRFLRKKVMQMVRASTPSGKHLGPAALRERRIMQTEKQSTIASPPLATSTKKLVHLSHQIVGKTVDDAITQMRFSKKKMAREVKFQLEEARDRAIAAHGMGLGAATPESQTKKIQTKDGRWIEVRDPTTLYVDQSWVTKGSWRGMRVQYHARGRMSYMWRPTAGITVVLKEEKTRIRQHDERVEAQAKKAPWVHLPNRPVTAQRQYYSW
ncbi:ribosomal protein L22 [Hypoxylon crocopeplum]|nr:ribosomal protein L22 [Hypoxylon crocopeplum]